MPESYGNEDESVKNPKREKRGNCWYPSLTQLAILSVITGAAAILTAVIYINAIWLYPQLPQESPASQIEIEALVDLFLTQEPPKEPVNKVWYTIYDIPLSEELQHYTQDICKEYGVSYPLVIAIMKKESAFQPYVVSATNDYGIMQINGGNHEWLEGVLGITDWFDPKQNILAGVYMLSQFNRCEDVHQILMSYNCGPSGAKKLWSEGVYSTAYSRSVVEILNGLGVVSDE